MNDSTLRRVLAAGLLVTAVLLPRITFAVEQLPYSVEERLGDVEIRVYPAHVLASLSVQEDFESAGNTAFRPLFRYISGNNGTDSDIAMTAPVLQSPLEDGWQVSFVMPQSYEPDVLPIPDDSSIRLQQVRPERLAALRYRGNWQEDRFASFAVVLREALDKSEWEICGPVRWARYDPPFMPGFLRRNEVLVPVGKPCQQAPGSP